MITDFYDQYLDYKKMMAKKHQKMTQKTQIVVRFEGESQIIFLSINIMTVLKLGRRVTRISTNIF